MAKRRKSQAPEVVTPPPPNPSPVRKITILRAARDITINGVAVKAGDEIAAFQSRFPLGCIMSALRSSLLKPD